MKIDIEKELRALAVKSSVLNHRHTAEMNTFQAACFLGDGKEADLCRQKIHSILDEQLDVLSRTSTLTRMLINDS